MDMVKLLSTILAVGILVGCGASVNPRLKSGIDAQIARLPSSGPAFGPPNRSGPPDLHVGDWSRYRDVNERGENSIVTLKIVGQEGSAWWIENTAETYYGRTVTLMLADLGNRTELEQIEVVRMLSKLDDSAPSEEPPMLIGMMSSLWKPLLAQLTVRWSGASQEDAIVPAGSFAQAYRRRLTLSFAGQHRTVETWSHPAVPIHGSVKSTGVDHKAQSELIGFGTGATSEIGIPADR